MEEMKKPTACQKLECLKIFDAYTGKAGRPYVYCPEHRKVKKVKKVKPAPAPAAQGE